MANHAALMAQLMKVKGDSPFGGSPQPRTASPSAMLTTARRLGAASAANSANRDGHRKIVRCPRAGGPPGCPQGRGCPRRRPIQSNRCCPAGATVRLSSSALQPAEAPRPSRRREAARCAEADPRGYQRRLKRRCAPALRDRRRFAPAHCAPRNRPWLCRRRRAPSVRCRDVGTTRGLGSAGDGGAHSGRSALGTERSFVMRLRRDAYRSQSVRGNVRVAEYCKGRLRLSLHLPTHTAAKSLLQRQTAPSRSVGGTAHIDIRDTARGRERAHIAHKSYVCGTHNNFRVTA